MKTAFALAVAAAAVVAPQADAGICCETTKLLGSELTVSGYDCTVGSFSSARCRSPCHAFAECVYSF